MATKIKVLMYGWEFPPVISGGLGVACHAIVQELAKKNIAITLILPHVIPNMMNEENISILGCNTSGANTEKRSRSNCGVDCDDCNTSSENLSTFLHPYLSLNEPEYLAELKEGGAKITEILFKLSALRTLVSKEELVALRPSCSVKLTGKYGMNLLAEVCNYAIIAGAFAAKVDHDVIHAHDWLTILAGVEAKKISGKPLIFHVHALEPDRSGAMVDTRIYAIEKYGMEHADKIVAVSEYTKRTIVEKYGIAADKIAVVYNGTYVVDEKISDLPAKKNKMVLFLGRLAQQKGPSYFIDVAKKIIDKRQDIQFVIAGTGGLMTEMINRVARLRIGKYVHFTGFLAHERINRVFKLADVYVMPSVSEPFGLSCLEALSTGIPVVVSKQSGVSEVLPHVVKVDFWDVNEMANKILALLDHQALGRVTMKQSVEDLHDLTWENTANTLISIYLSVIKTK